MERLAHIAAVNGVQFANERRINMADMVNHPAHYGGKIECIDAMESAVEGMPADEAIFAANVIKYVWRYREKNGAQDLAKAEWYLHRLMRNYGSKTEEER